MRSKGNLLWAFGLAVMVLGLLFAFYGYENTWRLWNIPAMSPHFADLRVITAGAESYIEGYDPLISNPGDPWQRRMNYPKVWQQLYLIGINQSHTTPIGIFSIALFLMGVYIYLPTMSNIAVAFIMAALLSPAVLLGIERANIDLIMFFLLSLSIVLLRRHHVLSLTAIIFAFVLKLFPIFAFPILLRLKPTVFFKLAIFSIVFAISYGLFNFDEISVISRATPRPTWPWPSYGIDVLWMKEARAYGLTVGRVARLLSYLTVLCVLIYSLTCLLTANLTLDSAQSGVDLDSFRAGSALYIGTFLLGNNWDYRLMFLLFAIPQLLAWARSSHCRISAVSKITIGGIYVSLWHLVIINIAGHSHLLFIVDEIFNWVAFCGLLYLLIVSMPEWVKHYVGQFTPLSYCSSPGSRNHAA